MPLHNMNSLPKVLKISRLTDELVFPEPSVSVVGAREPHLSSTSTAVIDPVTKELIALRPSMA